MKVIQWSHRGCADVWIQDPWIWGLYAWLLQDSFYAVFDWCTSMKHHAKGDAASCITLKLLYHGICVQQLGGKSRRNWKLCQMAHTKHSVWNLERKTKQGSPYALLWFWKWPDNLENFRSPRWPAQSIFLSQGTDPAPPLLASCSTFAWYNNFPKEWQVSSSFAVLSHKEKKSKWNTPAMGMLAEGRQPCLDHHFQNRAPQSANCNVSFGSGFVLQNMTFCSSISLQRNFLLHWTENSISTSLGRSLALGLVP